MPKVESIQSNHPLIGTWITENDDSAVDFEYTIKETWVKVD